MGGGDGRQDGVEVAGADGEEVFHDGGHTLFARGSFFNEVCERARKRNVDRYEIWAGHSGFWGLDRYT